MTNPQQIELMEFEPIIKLINNGIEARVGLAIA